MTPPRAVGVDYGSKRIGIAATDPLGIAARPLEVIVLPPGPAAADRIAEIARDRDAEILVFGMPFNMDGSEHSSAKRVRAFARLCEQRTKLPVAFVDERLTTVEAERHMSARGIGWREAKSRIDAVAAAVLLQDWLEGQSG